MHRLLRRDPVAWRCIRCDKQARTGLGLVLHGIVRHWGRDD